MKILITGSTGFIGQKIVRELLEQNHQLFLLIRPESKEKARKMYGENDKISYISGDITKTDVIQNIYSVVNQLDEVDTVLHLAALYNLEASYKEAYEQNVIGTQNIILLLDKMKNVKHFHYYSTYAVNPIIDGATHEDFLVKDDKLFTDFYALTKNHAEHLIRSKKNSHYKIVIHRPGVIIGDSQNGSFEKIDGPYFLFEVVRKIKDLGVTNLTIPFLPLPIHQDANIPVLPIDVLAKWSVEIMNNPPKENIRCYHLVPEQKIRSIDFLEASLDLLQIRTRVIPLTYYRIMDHFFPLVKIPKETLFYMNQRTIFDQTNLKTDYPDLKSPSYQQYLPQIIQGFLRGKR